MEAPSPVNAEDKSTKDIIREDLKKAYKDILSKYLDEREYKENKIKSWIDNILSEAKDYFIKKYPNYDIFLHVFVATRNTYFRSNYNVIYSEKTDDDSSTSFLTDQLYSCIYFFFFQKKDLTFTLEDCESEIMQKGNDIMIKHLEERKYNYDKIQEYNKNINNEHIDFILEKIENNQAFKCYCLNEIFQVPIKGKYVYKSLCYGKNIYSKISQSYANDSLICFHHLFFFKS